MPTRLHSIAVDAAHPPALARFWSTATGWPITAEGRGELVVAPAADDAGNPTDPGLPLVFGPTVDDRKVSKNRVHLDLASRSAEHQAEMVERLRRAGATPHDIGQGAVPWVVLADPEGNEFCVLEPRSEYAATGALAAVVLDTPDPEAVAPFWAAASGRSPTVLASGDVRLSRPDDRGPYLELLRSDDPDVGRNRLHLVIAPVPGDDQIAEVERLRALGAVPAEVGQGERSCVVLAGPGGDQLCVLCPPD